MKLRDILSIFRKKEEKEEEKPEEEEPTELESICADDNEVYEALHNTMFLDPRKIETSMEEAVKKAKEFEKSNDTMRARMWYEIAGGLAISEGDVKKVKQYFTESQRLLGRDCLILKIPEKAVQKAQEYYKKYPKTGEEIISTISFF